MGDGFSPGRMVCKSTRAFILAVVYVVTDARPVIWCSALQHCSEVKMTKGRMKKAGIIYLISCILYVLVLVLGYSLLVWHPWS
jgi:hypothetical protein